MDRCVGGWMGGWLDGDGDLIQGVHQHHAQHGPKDLLVVGLHPLVHAGDDGGPHEVALWVLGHGGLGEGGAGGGTWRPSSSSSAPSSTADWTSAQIRSLAAGEMTGGRSVAGSWPAPSRRFAARRATWGGAAAPAHLGQPLARLAHQHGRGERHAPLARRTEGRAHQLVDGVLLVGVRHDDAVVLGAHVALHALAWPWNPTTPHRCCSPARRCACPPRPRPRS